MHARMRAYIHAYMQTCRHTHIHTHIHAWQEIVTGSQSRVCSAQEVDLDQFWNRHRALVATISTRDVQRCEVAGCGMIAPTSLESRRRLQCSAPLPDILSKIAYGLRFFLESLLQENREIHLKLRTCTSSRLLWKMRHMQFFEVAFQSGLETRAHGRRPEGSILHHLR